MKIIRSSQTYEDLVEIAAYYGADDATVADRFFDSYELSLQTLKRNPKIGFTRHTKTGEAIRIWMVKNFENVLILYREAPNEIVIMRVIHSARDYNRFI